MPNRRKKTPARGKGRGNGATGGASASGPKAGDGRPKNKPCYVLAQLPYRAGKRGQTGRILQAAVKLAAKLYTENDELTRNEALDEAYRQFTRGKKAEKRRRKHNGVEILKRASMDTKWTRMVKNGELFVPVKKIPGSEAVEAITKLLNDDESGSLIPKDAVAQVAAEHGFNFQHLSRVYREATGLPHLNCLLSSFEDLRVGAAVLTTSFGDHPCTAKEIEQFMVDFTNGRVKPSRKHDRGRRWAVAKVDNGFLSARHVKHLGKGRAAKGTLMNDCEDFAACMERICSEHGMTAKQVVNGDETLLQFNAKSGDVAYIRRGLERAQSAGKGKVITLGSMLLFVNALGDTILRVFVIKTGKKKNED